MFRFLATFFRPPVRRRVPTSQPILVPTPVAGVIDSTDAFARLNEVAPLITVHDAASDAPASEGKILPFVCREAILNRDERIGGYASKATRCISLPRRIVAASIN